MLDSLLLVEGESERHFDFTLDFDQPYPMRTATEVLQPLLPVTTASSIPAGPGSAWILGLSAKNVIVARTRWEPAGVQSSAPDDTDQTATSSPSRLVSAAAGNRRPVDRVSGANGPSTRQCETAAPGRNGNSGTADLRERHFRGIPPVSD